MKSKVRSSFSWFLSILLVLTMMPAMALTAYADDAPTVTAPTYTGAGTPETTASAHVYGTTGATLGVTATPQDDGFTITGYQWYETQTESVDPTDTTNVSAATGTGNNAATYTLPADLGVNTHKFFCRVEQTKTADSSKSYAASSIIEVTVTQAEVSLAWGTTTSFTYSGAAQEPTVTPTPAGTITKSFSGKSSSTTTYGPSATAPTNVGDYTETVTLSDPTNYKFATDTVTTKDFSIGKKAVTITALDQTVAKGGSVTAYNNTYDTQIASYVSAPELATGDALASITVACNQSTAATGAFEEAITISAPVIKAESGNGADVTSNYDITLVKGTLFVGTASTTPTIVGPVNDLDTLVYGSISSTDHHTLSVTATPDTGGTLSYQWYSNDEDSYDDATEISGANTAIYQIKEADLQGLTTYFFCKVTYAQTGDYYPVSENSVKKAVPVSPVSDFTLTAKDQTVTKGVAISVDPSQVTPSPALFSGDTLTAVSLSLDSSIVSDTNTVGTFEKGIVATAATITNAAGFDVTAFYGLTAASYLPGDLTVTEASSPSSGGGRTSGGGGGGLPATTPTTTPTDTPATTPTEVVNPTPSNSGTSTVGGFKDVKAGAYYAGAVAWAVGAGITNGTSADTFSPEEVCTRGQIVTFIWRAAGSPEPTGTVNPFTDVKEGAYYYKAVLWAVEKGVATGTSATTFDPDKTVTRGEAVTFLYRAKGESLATAGTYFSDVDPDAFYADAVAWAAANGVTTGTSATTFSPNEKCTRGQIVTFQYRAE